jgi:hypothetical protein
VRKTVRTRKTAFGILGAALAGAALTIASNAGKIANAIDDPYWSRMTIEEWAIFAVPVAACLLLLAVAVVIAIRQEKRN